MKTRGVIFDLFGTLVESLSVRALKHRLAAMADSLSVAPDRFAAAWVESFPRRAVDVRSSMEESIEWVCREIGGAATAAGLNAATAAWFEYMRGALVPRRGAVELLTRLKEAGLRLGLISDCSAEVPLLWEETPLAWWFDAVSFSCREGVKKPDPEIFQSICRRLALCPGDCLYVADGSNRELHTACELGMSAVLIRPPDEDPQDVFRTHPESWTGPAVTQLSDVAPLVGLE